MTAVKRTRRGLVVSFDEVEASLLRHLVGEVRTLLAEDEPSVRDAPRTDPARSAGRQAVGPGLPTDAELTALTGLGGLAQSARDLAGPGDREAAGRARPDDPALARLLPDGYRDDPDAAGEFRRLTESSLRREKVAAAERMLAALPADGPGEVRLDAAATETWLGTLNDVRLALGTRLDVTEEMVEPDPDDPDAPAYVVYLWLTELQGVLVEVAEG
ncbi:MAG TPA: DUF2017 domain-containing protein [Mycobacteriales bacterium]|nr:DUF2017 domain-containing protein [Mycobacteriales bacterium]